jgi:hypothetical protein
VPMAISVRKRVIRAHRKVAFMALAAWMGLSCTASCLSDHEAPVGARIKNPRQRAPIPATPAEESQEVKPAPPRGPFSALDQVIADDCIFVPNGPVLGRAWSQDVPERECTKDDECSDGFCDRGRCAAIWTCGHRYGQHCVDGKAAPSRGSEGQGCIGLCLDGRCRSCVSDAECVEQYGYSALRCNPQGWERSGARSCGIPGPKVNSTGPGLH